jgi:hypothetical protein
MKEMSLSVLALDRPFEPDDLDQSDGFELVGFSLRRKNHIPGSHLYLLLRAGDPCDAVSDDPPFITVMMVEISGSTRGQGIHSIILYMGIPRERIDR